MSLIIVKEVPKFDCESGRHEMEDKGEVTVEYRFLFLVWRVEKDKEVCKNCGKIKYSSTFSWYDGGM